MSSFTPEQQNEITNLIRKVTDPAAVLTRQLQNVGGIQIGDLFPSAQNGPTIATRTDALVAAGTTHDQNQYAELFAAIGSDFNTGGEPPGTFRIPNAMGMVLVGAGLSTGLSPRTTGQYGGAEDAVVVSHNHGGATASSGNHAHDIIEAFGSFAPGVSNETSTAGSIGHYTRVNFPGVLNTTADGAHTHTIPSAGVSGTGANMPPFVVVRWMIKAM